jgi:SpoIID/LytB domain protein
VKARAGIAKLVLAAVLAAALFLPAAPAAGSSTLYFFGHGLGHGAGMCMAGVYYRALDGETYDQIIHDYYTGVSISQTTDDRTATISVKERSGNIRTMSMYEYLCHLREEPDDWPFEGLKTLMTAARTFAYSRIRKSDHHPDYDVCSYGSHCQAYDESIDVSKRPNTVAAINATSGKIITYNGAPIVAAYSACCGGRTVARSEPYLQSVIDDACIYDENRDWSVACTWDEFQAAMADLRLGELYGYSIEARTADGRVSQVRLEGSDGSSVLSGEKFHQRLGLPTTFFNMATPRFHEYILVQNPSEQTAHATFTYMLPVGDPFTTESDIAPHSRFTLPVHDVVANSEVSVRLDSSVPVVAERAMYFNYGGGIRGGHDSPGVAAIAKRWYLAEGYTGGAFDTWVLLQNPQELTANVTVRFLTAQGVAHEDTYEVAPRSRSSIGVDQLPGLEAAEVSTVIDSDIDIVAERSMYCESGGTCSPAEAEPAASWLLPEGYTGGSFDTYVLVMNPQAVDVNLTFTFMLPGGGESSVVRTVAPNSRFTLHLDEVPGLAATEVSTRVDASAPVVAERAMYFDYEGWTDGHCSNGIKTSQNKWLFAEGCTYDNFHTYLLLQNPGEAAANASIAFMLEDGSVIPLAVAVEPHSRYTVFLNAVPGLAGHSVSTSVSSDLPIAAERSVYFNYQGWDGGHCAVGANTASTTWYFAEGYTGF